MTVEEICWVIRACGLPVHYSDPDDAIMDAELLRDALVDMLRRGGHRTACDVLCAAGDDPPCTCGWSEIERAARDAGVVE